MRGYYHCTRKDYRVTFAKIYLFFMLKKVMCYYYSQVSNKGSVFVVSSLFYTQLVSIEHNEFKM